jgi:hypothetical protein
VPLLLHSTSSFAHTELNGGQCDSAIPADTAARFRYILLLNPTPGQQLYSSLADDYSSTQNTSSPGTDRRQLPESVLGPLSKQRPRKPPCTRASTHPPRPIRSGSHFCSREIKRSPCFFGRPPAPSARSSIETSDEVSVFLPYCDPVSQSQSRPVHSRGRTASPYPHPSPAPCFPAPPTQLLAAQFAIYRCTAVHASHCSRLSQFILAPQRPQLPPARPQPTNKYVNPHIASATNASPASTWNCTFIAFIPPSATGNLQSNRHAFPLAPVHSSVNI